MMGDDSSKSSNIIILKQIEDCRDRNDHVLQFTVDPVTFGYPSNTSSSSSILQPQYSINDLKNLLDDELIKNFSLTSTSNELIYSAVNCSLLLCMRVLTSLRKKSWIILTSNAYLDIYTNCIVKTFYFEKYSQSKLFAASSPTAASNTQSIPAFAPRSNLVQQSKRTSTVQGVKSDNDPLQRKFPDTDLPSSRSSINGNNDPSMNGARTQQQQSIRRDSLRRQPPPPPATVIKKLDSVGSDGTSSKITPPSPQILRNSPHSFSTNSISLELNDPEEAYKSQTSRVSQGATII